MVENYEELFQRIRARCLQQRWHGPDTYNPFEIVSQMREREVPKRSGSVVITIRSTRYWYDHNRKQYAINIDTDLDNFPLQTAFEYPPVAEQDLDTAEEELGYPLPPLLRALYTQVANGGFGPGYGLPQIRDHALRKKDDSAWERYSRPVNLAIYLRKTSSSAYFEVPDYAWPDNLFGICDWGCGIVSYLDCVSGQIFRGEAGRNGNIFCHEADSLYEWLDLWLNGVDFWARMNTQGQENA